MKVIKQPISEVLLFEPQVYPDVRGYFVVTYEKSIFARCGVKDEFTQDNYNCSEKGVIRGLHYQLPPKAQAKLIRVVKGAVYDVAVDIRKTSPTFCQHVAARLSAENKKMLFVPKGFAHGFCALEPETEVAYKVSGEYAPDHEGGVYWNDPALAIQWPKLDCDYILNDRDSVFPPLAKAEVFEK